MPSMLSATDRASILSRLDRLTPDAMAQWGTMNVTQMLAHLADAMRMALGDLAVKSKRIPLFRFGPVKWAVLNLLPFPKNAPTADELKSRAPRGFEEERADVRALVARLEPANRAPRAAEHPIFGPMTTDDWGTLGFKHTDHHLRQFGV
jgi:Protein of unknown function (DUF1569)